MPCCKCSADGRLLCEKCVRTLVDGILADHDRQNGVDGFKPVEEDGVDVLTFLMERCGPAVDWLHAAASEMKDPVRAREARESADKLFAAYKEAKNVLLRP